MLLVLVDKNHHVSVKLIQSRYLDPLIDSSASINKVRPLTCSFLQLKRWSSRHHVGIISTRWVAKSSLRSTRIPQPMTGLYDGEYLTFWMSVSPPLTFWVHSCPCCRVFRPGFHEWNEHRLHVKVSRWHIAPLRCSVLSNYSSFKGVTWSSWYYLHASNVSKESWCVHIRRELSC